MSFSQSLDETPHFAEKIKYMNLSIQNYDGGNLMKKDLQHLQEVHANITWQVLQIILFTKCNHNQGSLMEEKKQIFFSKLLPKEGCLSKRGRICRTLSSFK